MHQQTLQFLCTRGTNTTYGDCNPIVAIRRVPTSLHVESCMTLSPYFPKRRVVHDAESLLLYTPSCAWLKVDERESTHASMIWFIRRKKCLCNLPCWWKFAIRFESDALLGTNQTLPNPLTHARGVTITRQRKCTQALVCHRSPIQL